LRNTSIRQLNRIPLLLFIFLFHDSYVILLNLPSNKHKDSVVSNSSLQNAQWRNYLKLLLMRSGDIELNPGPQFDIKIIHLNARSIPRHKTLIEAESNKFDIITCSETWFTASHTKEDADLAYFHSPVRLDRSGQGGGGVAIYVKRHLMCKHRLDLHTPGLEAVWIETKLNKELLLVGSFYRQPSLGTNYWELVQENFRKVNNTGLKYIALGDFNSDFNFPSKHLLDIINTFQLHQLTNSDTRITDTSSTRIDLVLTQTPQIVKHVEVLPEICSDHCVPCVTIISTTNTNYSYKRTLYSYDKLNQGHFNELLSQTDWTDIVSNNPINESVEKFTKFFFETACKCMPIKTVTIRSRDAIWMTADIHNALKERYKLFLRAKRSNKNTDWLLYRQNRNNVTTMIRVRKLEYVEELNQKASDPTKLGNKDWWKIVKSFMKKKGLSDDIPPISHNGQTFHSPQDKANVFNKYFIQQSTLENKDDEPPNLEQLNCELTDISLTSIEITTVIKKLDKNKAVGPDKIHNKLLIAAVDFIAEPLCILFNRSLTEGIVPDMWKTAHITPVHKKGPCDQCSNYRPISLLSCLGKVLERCIHNHIFTYFKQNEIISANQSGFIPGDSTTNQLLMIYNDLCKSYDLGITTQSIYFDISRAFDRVWHKGLLKKLEAVGLRGTLLIWLSNYLEFRKQAVVLNGKTSDYHIIPAGVPQGSVLGPLLFLVYINDIVDNIQSIIKLFADDTSMSCSMKNPIIRADTLNSDLRKVYDWARTWKVNFNAEKTELLTFKRNTLPVYPLSFGSSVLQEKDTHKHLGLTIQNNCKWDQHINNIIRTVTLLLSCLRSYKYSLSRKALENMYKSFVLPHFDYADVIWDNCTEGNCNRLEKLHLEAIRIILGTVKGTSHELLYSESGFCPLKERRRRHKLIYFHKMLNDRVPASVSNLTPPLVSSTNPYHRRRPLERKVPTCKTELYKKSFVPSTAALWNDLPENIQSTTSLSLLKKFLSKDETIVPSYYYYGKRKPQLHHCRLRLGMSDLKYDLYRRHLIEDPVCACGHPAETSEHFLLHCPLYTNARTPTLGKLDNELKDIHTLLFGNDNLSLPVNINIFSTVQDFVAQSGRF